MTNISILIFSLIFIIIFLVQPIQAYNQTRTFSNCYSDIAKKYLLESMFTPKSIDLTDPAVKNFISSFCNLFHEKTGFWVDIKKDDEINSSYLKEFIEGLLKE